MDQYIFEIIKKKRLEESVLAKVQKCLQALMEDSKKKNFRYDALSRKGWGSICQDDEALGSELFNTFQIIKCLNLPSLSDYPALLRNHSWANIKELSREEIQSLFGDRWIPVEEVINNLKGIFLFDGPRAQRKKSELRVKIAALPLGELFIPTVDRSNWYDLLDKTLTEWSEYEWESDEYGVGLETATKIYHMIRTIEIQEFIQENCPVNLTGEELRECLVYFDRASWSRIEKRNNFESLLPENEKAFAADLLRKVHQLSSERRLYYHLLRTDYPSLPYFDPTPNNRKKSLKPGHVKLWDGFKEEVLQHFEERACHYMNIFVPRKECNPYIKVEGGEYQGLQTYLLRNLLNMVDLGSQYSIDWPQTTKLRKSCHATCFGKPDFKGVDKKSNRVAFLVEAKNTWLKDPDIVGIYNEQKEEPGEDVSQVSTGTQLRQGIVGAVEQLYGYIRFNLVPFGVLSSYNTTYFCRRELCEDCGPESDPHEVMKFSQGFDVHCIEPTIGQCFAYFMSLCNSNEPMKSPPPPSARQRSRSLTRLQQSTHRPTRTRASSLPCGDNRYQPTGGTTAQLHTEKEYTDQEVCIDHDAVPLKQSRTLICHGKFYNKRVILKIADRKEPELIKEIRHEAIVYNNLLDLQTEKRIPTLLGFGWINSYFYFLALEDCGNVLDDPSKLSIPQKNWLRETLKKLHKLGYVHGDLHRGNVVIDNVTKVAYLIDFGFSSKTNQTRSKKDEIFNLNHLLEPNKRKANPDGTSEDTKKKR